MTFLEALLMKWSEKQPSCTGLRREWETTLEAGSGGCPLKTQEIGDTDKNCRMGMGGRGGNGVGSEGFILFRMGNSFYKLLRRIDDPRKALMGKAMEL